MHVLLHVAQPIHSGDDSVGVLDFVYGQGDDPNDGRGLLWLALDYADGRTVTTVDSVNFAQAKEEAVKESLARPILRRRYGAGFALHAYQEYWLTPLPPTGPLTIRCTWDKLGVTTQQVNLDGQLFVDAAATSAN